MTKKASGTPYPLSRITTEKIIHFIKERNIQPGDKLPTEYELATLFAVGRSTIREAVRALASRNILVIRQGAGTFLSDKGGVPNDPLGLSLLHDDIRLALDMLDFRLIVEPETAALAAAHMSQDKCRLLREKCDACEALIRKCVPYHKEDAEFHEAIAIASDNQIIAKVIQVIHASIIKNIFVTSDSLRENTIDFHRQITEAVCRSDVMGARSAMGMHLAALRQCVVEKKYKVTDIEKE